VQATALPTVPVAGQLIVTVGATIVGLMLMVVEAVAVAALPSVAVTLTVKVVVVVTVYVVVKLTPVPDAGLPPVAVQAKEYGVVPPVTVAVKVTAVPEEPVVGPAIVTPRVRGAMVIVAEADAVLALASVTITETVRVPFTLYVVEKLAPVPEAGVPPVAVQANE